MNHLSRKELLLIIGTVVLGLIVFISYLIVNFSSPSVPTVEVTVPSSVPASSSGQIPEPSLQPIVTTEPVIIDHAKINGLKTKLPFYGKYIILKYDAKDNIFLYAYQKNFLDESTKELQDFLAKNGFTDRRMLDAFGMHEYFY